MKFGGFSRHPGKGRDDGMTNLELMEQLRSFIIYL